MRSWVQIVASDNVSDAELDHYGAELRTVTVIRFLDNSARKRWFYRDHVELGQITCVHVDGRPAAKERLLAVARENFGADCSVIW